ncbi:hypothetical protein C7999DRAFT_31847 [Corynascus novoguineensis]|uniref:Uncharacterized protein n=1 Tax=Corynascus novoguineensis TaxID=1126955 RepID=A0AAN7CT05_9PEZI|nr:hypothetical protein C7999DRAFT_31847 [Corynascus novoguineensis]
MPPRPPRFSDEQERRIQRDQRMADEIEQGILHFNLYGTLPGHSGPPPVNSSLSETQAGRASQGGSDISEAAAKDGQPSEQITAPPDTAPTATPASTEPTSSPSSTVQRPRLLSCRPMRILKDKVVKYYGTVLDLREGRILTTYEPKTKLINLTRLLERVGVGHELVQRVTHILDEEKCEKRSSRMEELEGTWVDLNIARRIIDEDFGRELLRFNLTEVLSAIMEDCVPHWRATRPRDPHYRILGKPWPWEKGKVWPWVTYESDSD